MKQFLVDQNVFKIDLALMNRIKHFISRSFLLLSVVIIFVQCPVKIGESRKSNPDSVLSYLLYIPMYSEEPVLMPMEITAYCSGSCCNSEIILNNDGKQTVVDWSNRIAASHARMDDLKRAGIEIVAVDTRIIPFGSIIKYEGRLYAALDRGGLIKGNCLDIAMGNHEAANHFGRRKNQMIEVYIPTDSEEATRIITGISSEAGR